jgi:hypothetical protein
VARHHSPIAISRDPPDRVPICGDEIPRGFQGCRQNGVERRGRECSSRRGDQGLKATVEVMLARVGRLSLRDIPPIFEAPTIAPLESRMGEIVKDTDAESSA